MVHGTVGLKEYSLNSLPSLMSSQKVLRSIFEGFGLSLLLAFVVIAVGANNWVVAFATCLAVSFVIIMLFGILGLASSNLGIFEAVDFSVVIAIALAYFTPLATAYSTACALERTLRIRKALEAVGPAILMGALFSQCKLGFSHSTLFQAGWCC